MSDPAKLDMVEMFGAAITAILAGIGGAMAWFRNSNEKLHTRMDVVEDAMTKWTDRQGGHTTQLAVIHTNQDHMTERLEEIRESTATTNRKLDMLSDAITDLAIASKRKP